MTIQKGFHWIKKGIIAIGTIIANPKKLYYVLNNEDRFKETLRKKYAKFDRGLPEISMEALKRNFTETISTYSFLGGNSSPIDIILLQILAQRYDGCRYLEIGTWRGESAINLERIAEKIYTINLSKEELERQGYPKEEIEAQDFYLKGNTNIQRIKSDTRTFDFSTLEQMDLVFIDGNHHHQAVKWDSKKVFTHLLHDHSIVVWHDYTRNFSTVWWEVFLGILDGVPPEQHAKLYHVRNTNCAVWLPFEVKTLDPINPFVPIQSYAVHVKPTTK